MVPHSIIGAYSDSDSQVLWEDGERVFRRGWRLDDNNQRQEVLIVLSAADHPSRSSLDRLTHEYELKDQLDGTGAVRGAVNVTGPSNRWTPERQLEELDTIRNEVRNSVERLLGSV